MSPDRDRFLQNRPNVEFTALTHSGYDPSDVIVYGRKDEPPEFNPTMGPVAGLTPAQIIERAASAGKLIQPSSLEKNIQVLLEETDVVSDIYTASDREAIDRQERMHKTRILIEALSNDEGWSAYAAKNGVTLKSISLPETTPEAKRTHTYQEIKANSARNMETMFSIGIEYARSLNSVLEMQGNEHFMQYLRDFYPAQVERQPGKDVHRVLEDLEPLHQEFDSIREHISKIEPYVLRQISQYWDTGEPTVGGQERTLRTYREFLFDAFTRDQQLLVGKKQEEVMDECDRVARKVLLGAGDKERYNAQQRAEKETLPQKQQIMLEIGGLEAELARIDADAAARKSVVEKYTKATEGEMGELFNEYRNLPSFVRRGGEGSDYLSDIIRRLFEGKENGQAPTAWAYLGALKCVAMSPAYWAYNERKGTPLEPAQQEAVEPVDEPRPAAEADDDTDHIEDTAELEELPFEPEVQQEVPFVVGAPAALLGIVRQKLDIIHTEPGVDEEDIAIDIADNIYSMSENEVKDIVLSMVRIEWILSRLRKDDYMKDFLICANPLASQDKDAAQQKILSQIKAKNVKKMKDEKFESDLIGILCQYTTYANILKQGLEVFGDGGKMQAYFDSVRDEWLKDPAIANHEDAEG